MSQQEFDKIADLRPYLANSEHNRTQDCLHYLGDKMQLLWHIVQEGERMGEPPIDTPVLVSDGKNWSIGRSFSNDKETLLKIHHLEGEEKLEKVTKWAFLPCETLQEFEQKYKSPPIGTNKEE